MALAQPGQQLQILGIPAAKDILKELIRTLSPRKILERMVGWGGVNHTKAVIEAIRKSAFAGIGPGNKAYSAYSEYYKKILAAAGKTGKPWLVGIVPGRTVHMLSKSRFGVAMASETRGAGSSSLDFVWNAANPDMAEYAEAHQEGRRGMPKRTWMHADNKKIGDAVVAAALLAIETLILQFEMEIRIST